MELWQLKTISTNQPLNEPQRLPKDWGPIFGLEGFRDRLGDLSWLGPDYNDKGWFVVGEEPEEDPSIAAKAFAKEEVAKLISESNWAVMPDAPITKGERQSWLDYRKQLREVSLQPDYPLKINWPVKPE